MANYTIFPVTPELTAITVAYKNKRLIADEVMPRVPVNKQEFKYRSYALADGFTVPNTTVGRLSAPNRVEFGFTESTNFCKDYGLDDGIPQSDVENAPPNYSPEGHAVEQLTNLIALDREVRVANAVFGASNYTATTNKSTLSGTTQWSHTSSTPVTAIMAALDGCVMRPNIMVISRAVYSKLRVHAQVVGAIYKVGSVGVVNSTAIADLFELEKVLIGESWVNSAAPGQTASLTQTWGKYCALLYQDTLANTTGGVSFGYTAQWGGRVAGVIEDKDMGMRGGRRVRVGESVCELITAPDLGYLFIDAVA